MTLVASTVASPGDRINFLPHHGVLRTSAAGSKIRVVFNGSARTCAGASLNGVLHSGPNLLPSLADVLTRWRRHRYVFMADVQMMYRQIQLHPDDRDLQQILWAENNGVSEYRLNTVTYGLASAPYLAIRVLRQLASDEANRFPLGADVLQHDVYVDDILTGAADLDYACCLLGQVTSLCMAGGFPLRKWASNDNRLLEFIPVEHQLGTTTGARLSADEHSVLGLCWNPHEDTFSLSVRLTPSAPPTKRTVLAQTARLFDPLGWLAPILFEWDAPLSREDTVAWTALEEELPVLEKIRLPRWLHSNTPRSPVELHGFSDASERAYAAVVYSRVEDGGLPRINLVVAKSRVAPLKRVSLPRLELCGAALLSKLAEHVRLSLGLERSAVTLWTDSTSLHKENPADCASRGVSPKELLEHHLWWRGPEYLRHHADFWPKDVKLLETADLPEQRPFRCHAAAEEREAEELCRFSCLRRLLRVSAWIWRWRARGRHSADSEAVSASLEPEELEAALSKWIQVAQESSYHAELQNVRAERTLPARSSLRKLVPILDDEGTLRVSGRLKHAILDADQRHPAILPPQSHLTHLVVDAAHRRTLHGGVQATLAHISSRAVHLEAVSDYTAEAFLAAFRRFVSRRGLCTVVYSDCGTNFVGADRQLKALFKAAGREIQTIVGHLADRGVRWSFNPPAAPHFGGLREAAVKAVKHHLRRTIGEARLTFEELSTFLTEVKACLNSRPLEALTDDPDDLRALTPKHFLVGSPLLAIPEPSLLDASANRLNRWRLLQQMRDHLWQRWTREYLQHLSPRPKWWATRGAILEGQLCLVKGENTPPCRWPLARITRVQPGMNGEIRVVDVRTSVGELTRPVVKIVPLPTAAAKDPEPPA
ncbi:uncharacterized protein LOC114931247 [Nylanderia fulva]|uniref:uncharacterized protein LOC114931247 n=1 Tax=Nylanderia fulva TaxID=613905 RepID=UPI0010FB986E|nr:uncharacterized protein LOC114931247 [Nylanderia fulva]